MANNTVSSLTENTRRYYLDAMGVQCWQLLDSEPPLTEHVDSPPNPDVSQETNIVSWPQLTSDVLACTNCLLHNVRKQAIVGRGNAQADLLFVLLTPTQADDEANVLCDGEAHQLLSKMLAAINIAIDDVYITSLLKCMAPASHTVSTEEIQSCHDYLQKQIQLLQPKLVVVLGESTAQHLLQKTHSLDEFRAMNVDVSLQIESIPMFVSYSPTELLQQPTFKRNAWSDLQQMQKLLESIKS